MSRSGDRIYKKNKKTLRHLLLVCALERRRGTTPQPPDYLGATPAFLTLQNKPPGRPEAKLNFWQSHMLNAITAESTDSRKARLVTSSCPNVSTEESSSAVISVAPESNGSSRDALSVWRGLDNSCDSSIAQSAGLEADTSPAELFRRSFGSSDAVLSSQVIPLLQKFWGSRNPAPSLKRRVHGRDCRLGGWHWDNLANGAGGINSLRKNGGGTSNSMLLKSSCAELCTAIKGLEYTYLACVSVSDNYMEPGPVATFWLNRKRYQRCEARSCRNLDVLATSAAAALLNMITEFLQITQPRGLLTTILTLGCLSCLNPRRPCGAQEYTALKIPLYSGVFPSVANAGRLILWNHVKSFTPQRTVPPLSEMQEDWKYTIGSIWLVWSFLVSLPYRFTNRHSCYTCHRSGYTAGNTHPGCHQRPVRFYTISFF
eukprot:284817995_6